MKNYIILLTLLFSHFAFGQAVQVVPIGPTPISYVLPDHLYLTTAEMRSQAEQAVNSISGYTYSPDGTLLEGGDGNNGFYTEIDNTNGVSSEQILGAINSQALSYNVTRLQTGLWFYVNCFDRDGNQLLTGKTQFVPVLRETIDGDRWFISEESRKLKLSLVIDNLSFFFPGAIGARMNIRDAAGNRVAYQSPFYLEVDGDSHRIKLPGGLLDAPGGEIIITIRQPDGRIEEVAYNLGQRTGNNRIVPINIQGAANVEGIEGIWPVAPTALRINIPIDRDGFGVNPVLETRVSITNGFYRLGATTSDGRHVQSVKVYRLTNGQRILQGMYEVASPNVGGWETAIAFPIAGLYHLIYEFDQPIRERDYPEQYPQGVGTAVKGG